MFTVTDLAVLVSVGAVPAAAALGCCEDVGTPAEIPFSLAMSFAMSLTDFWPLTSSM